VALKGVPPIKGRQVGNPPKDDEASMWPELQPQEQVRVEAGHLEGVFWTELLGASWPDKLVFQDIVWKWNVCRYVY
jgi:hypothetical protein